MHPRCRLDEVPHQLTSEVVLGKRHYIAAYEGDPSIVFRAATPREAVRQLSLHMGELHQLLSGVRFPTGAGRPARPAIAPR